MSSLFSSTARLAPEAAPPPNVDPPLARANLVRRSWATFSAMTDAEVTRTIFHRDDGETCESLVARACTVEQETNTIKERIEAQLAAVIATRHRLEREFERVKDERGAEARDRADLLWAQRAQSLEAEARLQRLLDTPWVSSAALREGLTRFGKVALLHFQVQRLAALEEKLDNLRRYGSALLRAVGDIELTVAAAEAAAGQPLGVKPLWSDGALRVLRQAANLRDLREEVS